MTRGCDRCTSLQLPSALLLSAVIKGAWCEGMNAMCQLVAFMAKKRFSIPVLRPTQAHHESQNISFAEGLASVRILDPSMGDSANFSEVNTLQQQRWWVCTACLHALAVNATDHGRSLFAVVHVAGPAFTAASISRAGRPCCPPLRCIALVNPCAGPLCVFVFLACASCTDWCAYS
jgi:hypothetical protein